MGLSTFDDVIQGSGVIQIYMPFACVQGIVLKCLRHQNIKYNGESIEIHSRREEVAQNVDLNVAFLHPSSLTNLSTTPPHLLKATVRPSVRRTLGSVHNMMLIETDPIFMTAARYSDAGREPARGGFSESGRAPRDDLDQPMEAPRDAPREPAREPYRDNRRDDRDGGRGGYSGGRDGGRGYEGGQRSG